MLTIEQEKKLHGIIHEYAKSEREYAISIFVDRLRVNLNKLYDNHFGIHESDMRAIYDIIDKTARSLGYETQERC